MKVIDAHVHLVQYICGTGSKGAMRSCGNGAAMYDDGTVYHLIPPEFDGGERFTPESMLSVFDANDVEKAVLLQGNFMGFQNLYSYDAQQRYPDRFLAAAAYDPFSRERDSIVHHLFEDLGIRVVKFEVSTGSGLMANRETIPLDGEAMEKEYAYCDDHHLIFVIDIGKMGSDSSQIPALRRVILRHPGMKFVVCHLLAPKSYQEEKMRDGLSLLALPNVWFDMAALKHNVDPGQERDTVVRHFVHTALDVIGTDRLLFGTDIPSNLCRYTYKSMVDVIAEDPDLSLQQKEQILYSNANRAFWDK